MNSRWKVPRAVMLTAALFITTTTLSLAESAAIPLDQLGAVATKQVEGDALSVSPTAMGSGTATGARLRCAFQRLEGRATPGGLWLSSTADGATDERFRLVATEAGRDPVLVGSSHCDDRPAQRAVPTTTLPPTGKVSITDQIVRFIRPGVTEEYSVSVDGLRQDFVISKRPAGEGELRVELALSGAHAAATAYGAKLTLDGSGRTLAYSRLRATDATARELKAHMEVLASNSESRKQKAETSQSLLTSAATSEGLVVLVDDADATYPIRIDPTFSDADWVSMNSLPGTDDYVHALLADSSGDLYLGGDFTTVGTVLANHIAKWDGSAWSALGLGMDGDVTALAVSGSDLYAGGSFTKAGGVTVNYIAKWDGSAWSALGSGLSGGVSALAISGTDFYVGGSFTNAGGVTVNHVAKWDGSTWSPLGTGISGMDQYVSVKALAVVGTDLYVGGWFSSAGGVTANNVAKWNGSTWSALGSGVNGNVLSLASIGSDLYAGGDFATAGGVTANHIARWNGASWSALGSGMSGNPSHYNYRVHALAVDGTDLYVGGWFGTAGGVPAYNIAKWNGSSWSALAAEIDDRMGEYDDVLALAVIGGDLYAGGWFKSAGGVSVNHVARYNGSTWSALGSGLDDVVLALAVSGSDLYAGGLFKTAGAVTANHVAKWNGSNWSALGSGMGGDNASVCALAVIGTDLYAAGIFTTAGGLVANRIAKWDGSAWSALGSGLGAPASFSEIAALAVSGSDLYVGGDFSTAGGLSVNNIAKWDGSSWSALGSGVSGGILPHIRALAVSGTELYAGGDFTIAGGVSVNNIAKWNGSSWSALGSGVDSVVGALTVMGTDLYVGGFFETAGGVPCHRVAKWDGGVWSALDSGTSSELQWHFVNALVTSGGDLYAGGAGYLDESTGYPSLARWSGSSWSPLGSEVSGAVEVLATDGNGHLFVGGRFLLAGGKVSPFIAQANIAGLDFTWGVISSPQEVSVPFPVTLTARSAAGQVRTDFTNSVNLSGYAPGVAATNVSIGTGTDSWGYPLRTSYHDARTQVIYLANELGRACTLNFLALEVTTPPGQTLENWTIRMKHTSLPEYPASPSWEDTGWSVVYRGDEPAGSAGWRTFEFSTPFDYNGTDNLLIDFTFNNASYSSDGHCQSTVMGAYRSLTYASDSKDGDPLSWSGTSPTPTRSYNVPNLVLGTSHLDLLPVSISPTVTTPFVNGVWTGEVTVQEAVTNLVLRVDDGRGHEGESNPFDVQGVVQPPVILTDDGQMGMTNGFFGFNVQGQAGQVVVIEFSTNLVDWTPILSNIAGIGPFYFSDPESPFHSTRFYRLLLP